MGRFQWISKNLRKNPFKSQRIFERIPKIQRIPKKFAINSARNEFPLTRESRKEQKRIAVENEEWVAILNDPDYLLLGEGRAENVHVRRRDEIGVVDQRVQHLDGGLVGSAQQVALQLHQLHRQIGQDRRWGTPVQPRRQEALAGQLGDLQTASPHPTTSTLLKIDQNSFKFIKKIGENRLFFLIHLNPIEIHKIYSN